MSHQYLYGGHAAASEAGSETSVPRWGGFQGDLVWRPDRDGRAMTLLEAFVYTDPRSLRWRVEAGTRLVGASLPKGFWPVIGGPYEGAFRNASVLHTAACAARIRPWRAIHRMFYEACRCAGVDAAKAKAMYYAMFHFGPRWHVEEPSSLVAGTRHGEPTIRDVTPAPPSAGDVVAIVDYFSSHDVAAEDIPKLDIPDRED
jgi:hypothetical protein